MFMVSNCADLTLSLFLYLTVRSPIWPYNYRNYRVRSGLSKNRQDSDGTGRSIPPAAGGHIVALMTRRGGRRDSN